MRYATALLVLCGLAGCGIFVPGDTQYIHCNATKEPVQCPPEDDVPRALRAFSKHVAFLDPGTPVIVEWYDWDHEFDDPNHIGVSGYINLNVSPPVAHVRNTGVMMHEFLHLFLFIETGDADENHSQPPGPWGIGYEAALDLAAAEFGTTNAVEMPEDAR